MEVCVDNIDSLINATSGGASRIELCSALSEGMDWTFSRELGVFSSLIIFFLFTYLLQIIGGLTPSIGFLKIAKSVSPLPIHVLIRSRSGDFCYDENDLKIMAEDAKQLGK